MMLRRFFLTLLAAFLLLPLGAVARAEVVVSFYSHEFGDHFPHAFVTLKGRVDATGEIVDTSYGFTAVSVSPGILFGSVKGKIQTSEAKYVASSDKQFSVTVDDAGYARVMAHVAKWRDAKQPSYSLNKRNCVHFVAELAALLGLRTNAKSKFFKKPRSYLQEVRALNPGLK
jgi:hypothetical protein